MLRKTIKFIASKEYINFTQLKPEPSILNIPQWYKNLTHSVVNRTIKGCMPFLDTLTAGYILKMPVDYYLHHNALKDGERGTIGMTMVAENDSNDLTKNLNINKESASTHPARQLSKGCPYTQKNKDLAFHKIHNPWLIKTPPGYSCLFLPPMNNEDDRFSAIPGIVDTDCHPTRVNFPIVVNGDKYPALDTVIKMGTPYVQVIPFKREQWKIKIESETKEKRDQTVLSLGYQVINSYKTNWWNKKSWK